MEKDQFSSIAMIGCIAFYTFALYIFFCFVTHIICHYTDLQTQNQSLQTYLDM